MGARPVRSDVAGHAGQRSRGTAAGTARPPEGARHGGVARLGAQVAGLGRAVDVLCAHKAGHVPGLAADLRAQGRRPAGGVVVLLRLNRCKAHNRKKTTRVEGEPSGAQRGERRQRRRRRRQQHNCRPRGREGRSLQRPKLTWHTSAWPSLMLILRWAMVARSMDPGWPPPAPADAPPLPSSSAASSSSASSASSSSTSSGSSSPDSDSSSELELSSASSWAITQRDVRRGAMAAVGGAAGGAGAVTGECGVWRLMQQGAECSRAPSAADCVELG